MRDSSKSLMTFSISSQAIQQDKLRLPADVNLALANILRPRDGLIGGNYLNIGNKDTGLEKNTRKFRKFKFLFL